MRLVLLAAVANLASDLWSWHDRTFAEGDRRYFRQAERADDIDHGIAELRIVNETGREFFIEGLGLDGWQWPADATAAARTLAAAGQPGSERVAQPYLVGLVGTGRLRLRDGRDGRTRLIDFELDRRRPTSCRVELRIQESGETVTECRPLRRTGPAYPWLLGPGAYQ